MTLYDEIGALFERITKPGRYIGGEPNSAHIPDECDVRYAFCFPDTYEIGMSHIGMKILYDIINAHPRASCERVFAPWVDMEAEMRARSLPLFSMETRRPVREFDLVGFTLQYEMSYTNILNMLDLAGIPLHSEKRVTEPFIIAGGPCAFNPEPLTDFVDVFALGDGEESTLDLIDCYAKWKASGQGRDAFLQAIAKCPGMYVPKIHDGSDLIKKAVVKNLDTARFPERIIVPFTDIVHDRVMLEIFRGCTRGCRFCQAGMIYRPVRERSVDTLMALAEKLLTSTGYEEISLSSLSTGDYSALPELARRLMTYCEPQRVAVSLPSLRVDAMLKDTLSETGKVKKSGLTFAPEAGTQRLRDVINKGVTRGDLLLSVKDAFSAGFTGVKLYFMIGLPTETYEDIDGIVELSREVVRQWYALPKDARSPGFRVSVSVAFFVPKPHTPFQWEAQDSLEVLREKQLYLKRAFASVKGVDFKYHDAHVSVLEAAFARGDRRLNRVIEAAWRRGARFDGWSEHFKFDLWMDAFAECGLDMSEFTGARDTLQPLPWEHIDAGVSKAFLLKERAAAYAGTITPDCRQGCLNCGLLRYPGVCGA